MTIPDLFLYVFLPMAMGAFLTGNLLYRIFIISKTDLWKPFLAAWKYIKNLKITVIR